MSLSNLRDRSLCLLNSENLDSTFQPWFTISDATFHPDVCALYCHAHINPIQSIQTDCLSPFISHLWPLVHRRSNVWAVDHPTSREAATMKFVLKYDLLIWDIFYRSTDVSLSFNGDIVYPKVLILAPDWCTCEQTFKHLSNVHTDVLNKVTMCCIYEGQNLESELYKKFLAEGADLLIATPTIVNDLIQKRHIHFERIELIVYDQFDLLLQNIESINEILALLNLHTNRNKSIQHFFLSRIVNQSTKDFIQKHFSTDKNYYFLSSSMMETYSYRDYFLYCEPCRSWTERKFIVKDVLDLAHNCHKKVLMCASQIRRLTTMQAILNDLSFQSTLVHSQLHPDEIKQYVFEWQAINDRPLILLIQDDILNDIPINNTDILIHLDVQRLLWYQLCNQRLKLVYKHLLDTDIYHNIKKTDLVSLRAIEKFYQLNPSSHIPLVILLWPGDCAHVTYELIDHIKNSGSYLHPLIERLAQNNCYESVQTKVDVELCPTLKMFGQCLNQKALKRCPYRHQFHYDVDCIQQKSEDEKLNENYLSDTYELYLPTKGEIELRITHVGDGNRLWAQILRSRYDVNQALNKIFDYELFYKQIESAFNHMKNRPLSEVVPGEIYFYLDQSSKIHRVYVHEQEQTYFNVRRADAILNRLLKVSNSKIDQENDEEISKSTASINEQDKIVTTIDRPALMVFSLDTGITFTLKSHEQLFPIEPSSLKLYPPLANEIILCNISPLDKITMTHTPFAIETLRKWTLNEVFMGRIKLATRSCFWIDPLVKPVRLAALKRIAYDKPIRKQLMLAKLVQLNDSHMDQLERKAGEAQLIEMPKIVQVKATEQSTESIQIEEKEISTVKLIETPEEPSSKPEAAQHSEQEAPNDDVVEDFGPVFKPFLNRIGQMIINPVGRSKEFFIKHNEHHPNSDFVKSRSSELKGINAQLSSVLHNEQSMTMDNSNANIDSNISIGRAHKINAGTSKIDQIPCRSPTLAMSDSDSCRDSNESSPCQTLASVQQSPLQTNVMVPSDIGSNETLQIKDKLSNNKPLQNPVNATSLAEASVPSTVIPLESKQEATANDGNDDNDQMMFIFGPKLFSQFRQIKYMEDEQRRQADFPVQRNRNRHMRNNNLKATSQDNKNDEDDDDNNETDQSKIIPPNMSRYEPFVDERGPLTQEQIEYKRTQRKTRLFWEQTSRDVYLSIGFYNVDSTQTRVEFDKSSICCRTKIRTYDRFVRVHLAHEIRPEKCLFQVRRSNILLTLRKADEGFAWTTLSNEPLEPRPQFFVVEYGSDDESDTEKRRQAIGKRWKQIREETKQSQIDNNTNNDTKYLIDDIDDDDPQQQQQQQQQQETDQLNNDDDDNNQQELTDTSSDCHSTDSDDCYYEDQVPASHIPAGYDDADYDHRFYGQQIRS